MSGGPNLLNTVYVMLTEHTVFFFDNDKRYSDHLLSECFTDDVFKHQCSPTWKPEESKLITTKLELNLKVTLELTGELKPNFPSLVKQLTGEAQSKLQNLCTKNSDSPKSVILEASLYGPTGVSGVPRKLLWDFSKRRQDNNETLNERTHISLT